MHCPLDTCQVYSISSLPDSGVAENRSDDCIAPTTVQHDDPQDRKRFISRFDQDDGQAAQHLMDGIGLHIPVKTFRLGFLGKSQ